ncbi:MAG: replicative DNA helicase [Firmicutes bacterium]|nr:replicative DNA helicase [Bacillota bacterium]
MSIAAKQLEVLEGKVPFVPMDLDAERRVLGILIKYPDKIDLVVDRLKATHFYDRVHRMIFQTILELYQSKGRISYTQVYAKLRKEQEIDTLEEVLVGITESFASPAELEPSVDVLLEKDAKRQILQAARKIEQMILLETEDSIEGYQAKAQELIFAATNAVASPEDDAKDLLEVLNKCYVNLLQRREGKSTHGLSVRYPSIDAFTTGFKKKDLIILAARPSMGKTSLALNFAVNVAKRNIPVLIFSLEMDDEQIGDRLVLGELFRTKGRGPEEVTAFDYATKMTDTQFAVTQSIFNELYKLPIQIVDKRGLTVAEIRAKARKVKAERPNLGLIIIDYLQLIKPPADSRKNWSLVVGDIVRELRDLAGELDLPLILLSQLNRGVESREDKRPMMSDLRDSGNIEEFADVIMFLYREDYYYPEQAAEKGLEGVTEVIFAKQRKGPTGKVKLRYLKEYTRFVEESFREEP